MKIRYGIAAVVGIAMLSLLTRGYAHGPIQATGQPHRSPTSAAQRGGPPSWYGRMPYSSQAFPGSLNPTLGLQQALVRTQLQNSVIAPQIGLSNAAGLASLAAQIAAQNPRITPQQALAQAAQQSSAIAAQSRAAQQRRDRGPRRTVCQQSSVQGATSCGQ